MQGEGFPVALLRHAGEGAPGSFIELRLIPAAVELRNGAVDKEDLLAFIRLDDADPPVHLVIKFVVSILIQS